MNRLDPAGLWAWAHADDSAGASLPSRGTGQTFLRDASPLHLEIWAGYFSVSPPYVHGVPSRHCFLSGCPLSMRQTQDRSPNKRKKLTNALTSEDSSNSTRKEVRAENTPETSAHGAVPGPWWPWAGL